MGATHALLKEKRHAHAKNPRRPRPRPGAARGRGADHVVQPAAGGTAAGQKEREKTGGGQEKERGGQEKEREEAHVRAQTRTAQSSQAGARPRAPDRARGNHEPRRARREREPLRPRYGRPSCREREHGWRHGVALEGGTIIRKPRARIREAPQGHPNPR